MKRDFNNKLKFRILENFGTRLEKLEKAVIPVHRQTKDLQRLQENIDKVMLSIDNVVAYHNVAKKNQNIINQIPQGNLHFQGQGQTNNFCFRKP